MVPEITKGQIRDPSINQSNMNGTTLKIKQNRKCSAERHWVYILFVCLYIYLFVSIFTFSGAGKKKKSSSP